jgi:hypothetical protein
MVRVKCWEIIADSLHDAGLSLGWVSAIDSEGRTIWTIDAHRGDRRRFVVRSDEKLTAFVELEREVFNRDVLSRIHSDRSVPVTSALAAYCLDRLAVFFKLGVAQRV